jgi:hypothetical protein
MITTEKNITITSTVDVLGRLLIIFGIVLASLRVEKISGFKGGSSES